MSIFPEFGLSLFNAFYFSIIIILVRYFLPSIINKKSLPELAYFPLYDGFENTAFWIYQITNTLLLFSTPFIVLKVEKSFFIFGIILYIFGLIGYSLSTADFSKNKYNGIRRSGLYKLSRNPMYIFYFLLIFSIGVMVGSILYIAITLVFQFFSHWLIKAEEQWCINQYGQEYIKYMKKVPRYILF